MTNKYNNVYINDTYSLLGSIENKPIVEEYCDKVINDYYMKKKTVEEGESSYQKYTISGILKRNLLNENDIDLLISSDLQNQNFASTFSSSNYNIPSFNVFSACASFCLELIIASNFINNNSQSIIITVSSNNLVNEKQFRFPIEYGSIKKHTNSFSSTGAISVLVSNKKSKVKVESSTIGKTIIKAHKDANDMGSCMAPPVAEVIHRHLNDLNREPSYYDLIITGDLGKYGLDIMKKYYKTKYKKCLSNVIDAGTIFYRENTIFAGASGPIVIPMILFNFVINKYNYKKLLIVASGALHSSFSTSMNLPMPGTAHAVSLEIE